MTRYMAIVKRSGCTHTYQQADARELAQAIDSAPDGTWVTVATYRKPSLRDRVLNMWLDGERGKW